MLKKCKADLNFQGKGNDHSIFFAHSYPFFYSSKCQKPRLN